MLNLHQIFKLFPQKIDVTLLINVNGNTEMVKRIYQLL